jgi:hypothetical protein
MKTEEEITYGHGEVSRSSMAIGARSRGIGGGVCACLRVERMREERGLATSFIGERGRRMDKG